MRQRVQLNVFGNQVHTLLWKEFKYLHVYIVNVVVGVCICFIHTYLPVNLRWKMPEEPCASHVSN